MITLSEALAKISNLNYAFKTQSIHIQDANGFICCEDVYSELNLPPFDKAAVDGFACRKSDIFNNLRVIDYVPAGRVSDLAVETGTCIRIMTGAKVSAGADCIIMIEDTLESSQNLIQFVGKETKTNICFCGEDVKVGSRIISKGDLLNPASLALLASVGIEYVKVFNPPAISLLTTGDELVELGNSINEGQIFNSNRFNLIARLGQTPAMLSYDGLVKDNPEILKEAINTSLQKSDIVILTGGVSAGDMDYVPEVLEKMGFNFIFQKLAIQPGKPVSFATNGNKYVFGLSGNPVSSLLQFELVVRPLIYSFMGNKFKLPILKVPIAKGIKRKKTDRQQFFPVAIENGKALPVEFHGSAHIAGLHGINAFGFYQIGQAEIAENELLDILLFN